MRGLAHKVLSRSEEQELAKAMRAGDRTARDKLITSNLRYVATIARKFTGYMAFEDLMQQGTLGLIHAVDKFDPDRGVRLVSYACWWVRVYLQRYIMTNHRTVKMGTRAQCRNLFFTLGRQVQELEDSGCEDPLAVIAKRNRLSRDDLVELQTMIDSAAARVTENYQTDEPSATAQLIDHERGLDIEEEVREAMKHLTPREQRIVRERLMQDQPRFLHEIGADMEIGDERIRRLEATAIEKLRRELGPKAKRLLRGS